MWLQNGQRIDKHQPPKIDNDVELNLKGLDLDDFRDYLLAKFSRGYALQIISYITRFPNCSDDPKVISTIAPSIRGNLLRACVNLAKISQ